MLLNDIGVVVDMIWSNLPERFNHVVLDEYVVMPNHLHGIIFLHGNVGAIPTGRPDFDCSDRQGRAAGVAPTGPLSGSIGAILAQFKSVVTKRVNQLRDNSGCPVWQRNYFERVIRNEQELTRAREYIVNNPLKWALDKENPELQIHGFKII